MSKPLVQAIAMWINDLASLYTSQGRYAEAEPLYQRTVNNLTSCTETKLATRSLTIRENALGPNHPEVAQSLNNLALLSGLCG